MDKAIKWEVDYESLAAEVTKYNKLLKDATLGYVKVKIWEKMNFWWLGG